MYKIYVGEKGAEHLREEDEKTRQNLPLGGLLMRDIDNHDTVTDWPARTETVAGNEGMEQIEVINYIIDGIPMVYCGNELADTAKLSMFANRFYPGKFEVTDRNNKNTPAALRRQEGFKMLNKLKAENDILRYGTMHWLDNSESSKVISFKREFGGKSLIFVGNASKETTEVVINGFDDKAKVLFSNNFVGMGENLKFEKYGYAVFEV